MLKNLVLSGSGSKFYIHLGAIKKLTEEKLVDNLTTYVGCSGGAIVSIFLAAGYSVDTIIDLFLKIDYTNHLKKINSDSILNFFENFGVDDGSNLERVFRIILKNKLTKTHLTFKEFFEKTGKNLVICSTNLNKNVEFYFNYKDTPDVDVIDAVLMSTSVPFIYVPKTYKGDFYSDGGILNFYPFEYISNKKEYKIEETIGVLIIPENYLCIEDPEKLNLDTDIDLVCNNSRLPITNFAEYIESIILCSLVTSIKEKVKKFEKNTILCLNNDNGLVFQIDYNIKNKYVDVGYRFAEKYLLRYTYPSNIGCEQQSSEDTEDIENQHLKKEAINDEDISEKVNMKIDNHVNVNENYKKDDNNENYKKDDSNENYKKDDNNDNNDNISEQIN